MNDEICCQCKEPTARAGRSALYAAEHTSAECGPLCLTCYNLLTNASEIQALTAQLAGEQARGKVMADALQIGLELAVLEAARVHQELNGYLPHKHIEAERDVEAIRNAISASPTLALDATLRAAKVEELRAFAWTFHGGQNHRVMELIRQRADEIERSD